MKIGKSHVQFKKNNKMCHDPEAQGGYWAIYVNKSDPFYEWRNDGDPEGKIFTYEQLVDCLTLCTEDPARSLTAYWRKTTKIWPRHAWKPILWRTRYGLVLGKICELTGAKRALCRSYDTQTKMPLNNYTEQALINAYESEFEKWKARNC